MLKIKTLTAVLAIVILSGCAGDFVDKNPTYIKMAEQEIKTANGAYIVKDNPAESKALIRPTVGTALSTLIIKPYYREAVEAVFKKSGRACHVTDVYPIGDFYEARYTCN